MQCPLAGLQTRPPHPVPAVPSVGTRAQVRLHRVPHLCSLTFVESGPPRGGWDIPQVGQGQSEGCVHARGGQDTSALAWGGAVVTLAALLQVLPRAACFTVQGGE